MATKTLMLDILDADGSPAEGVRITVKRDRDVAMKSGSGSLVPGVIPGNRTVGVYTIKNGVFPSLLVVPADDPGLQSWSVGYSLLITAEPAPGGSGDGGFTGGYWVINITTGDPATVRLSTKGSASPLPANVTYQQFIEAFSRIATIEADNVTTRAKADQALATAQATIAPTDNQVKQLMVTESSLTWSELNNIVKARTLGSTAGVSLNTLLLQRIRAHTGYLATEFGVYGDGTHDDTAALQSLINTAAAAGAKVLLPPGVYLVTGLTLSNYAQVEGVSGQTSLLSRNPSAPGNSYLGSVVIRRAPTSTSSLITVNGGGVGLANVTLSGAGGTASAPLLDVQYGYEASLDRVRVANQSAGVGAHFGVLNNSTLRRIFVDYCGTASAPAVNFDSRTSPSNSNNTTTVYDMHIERAPGAALWVANGTDDTLDYVEALKFFNLHAESPIETGTSAPDPSPTTALVTVGNGGPVEFIAPYLRQDGGAPVLVHNAQTNAGLVSGTSSLKVTGGLITGSKGATLVGAGTAAPATPYLVVLTAGNGFSMVGTDLLQAQTAGVKVAAGYGPTVTVQPGLMRTLSSGQVVATVPSISDARTGAADPLKVSYRTYRPAPVSSDITITGTQQDILTRSLVCTRDGVVTVRSQIDVAYLASDGLAINVGFNGVVTGTAVQMFTSASAGRQTMVKEWSTPVAAGTSMAVALKIWRYAGSGTTNTVKSGSSMTVTYEALA